MKRIYRYQLKSNYLKNRTFSAAFFFYAFLESTISLQCSEEKNEALMSYILEVVDSKRCACLNA